MATRDTFLNYIERLELDVAPCKKAAAMIPETTGEVFLQFREELVSSF